MAINVLIYLAEPTKVAPRCSRFWLIETQAGDEFDGADLRSRVLIRGATLRQATGLYPLAGEASEKHG